MATNGNEVIIINAIIAVIVSAIGAIISYFLSVKKSEKDAQRDYVYAARKKLYENYEPLVFQFHQLCESGYERIADLAERLRKGLELDATYVTNTIYRIMAPLAVFKLMEQKLTEFDVDLDQKIKYEYLFGKALFNLLRNDTIHNKDAEDEVDSNQAIHSSDLDNVCRDLLTKEQKDSDTVMIVSIGEFLNENNKGENHNSNGENHSFNKIFERFRDLSPDDNKIFWHNILGYAYICKAICTIAKTPEDIRFRLSQGYFSIRPEEFFWHNEKMEGKNTGSSTNVKNMSDVISKSFEYAKVHLLRTIKGQFGNT